MSIFPSNSELLSRQLPYLIAEIGINHNGDINIAKQLIEISKNCGFDAVKFQKRTVEKVYSEEELEKSRESVFGFKNRDLKIGLEFGLSNYQEIDIFCKNIGITWFASPWDLESVDFLKDFELPAYKVASACLTDSDLLRKIRDTEKPIILSTGMSTLHQIEMALKIVGQEKTTLLHCVSTYPALNTELNLSVIETLRSAFGLPVGYSGHEKGILPSVIAASKYKAAIIERHVTLDRTMWGSDQSASLEPAGMAKLVQYLKESIECIGNDKKRILDSEVPILNKLRRVKDF